MTGRIVPFLAAAMFALAGAASIALAGDLWSEYPLEPDRTTPPPTPKRDGDLPVGWLAAVIALAVIALAAAAVAIRRRSRRRAAPGGKGETPSVSIAAGGLEGTAVRVGEMLAQVLLLVLTARLMEPDGRGLYALASLAALCVGLPLGSVWTANAIELTKGRLRPGEILGASVAVAAAGGLAMAAIGIAASPALGDRWWVLAVPAAAAPFILIARYVEGLYQALGHIRAVNAMVLGRVLLAIAFVGPALFLGASDRIAIVFWTLSLVALGVLGFVSIRRRTVPSIRVPRARSVYRRLVTSGLKLAAGSSSALIIPRLALVVIAVFSTTAEVGVYSVAIAVSEMLFVAVYALDMSAFHGISTRDESDAIGLTRRAYRHAIVLVLAGAAVLIPGAVLGLEAVVGEGYQEVPVLLAILIPGTIAQAVGRILFAYFAVRRESPGFVTRVALLMAVLNIPLTIALVPALGGVGAAIAASAAAVVANGVLTRRFLRETGMGLASLVPGSRELRDYHDLAASFSGRLRRGSA